MAYPTTATLVAASSVAELTGLSTPQKDALREMAILAVERYTGQIFEPFEGSVVVDGGGATELFVPRRVEELTEIAVHGTSIDLTDVVVGENGDQLHFAPIDTGYYAQALREVAYDTRTFRAGSGTVILTGTFGWTVCPPAVVQALRLEMEAQAQADSSGLSGTIAAYRRLGMATIRQGNLSGTIGDPSEITPQSERLLSKLVWTGAGGYLV